MKKLFLFLISILFCFSFESKAQVDLTKGLIAYYPMTGNAKSTVGTGLDLTVNGATLTADRFGHPNSAYYFSGTSSLVGNFNSTGFTGMSFGAWIKTSSTDIMVILQVDGDVAYVNRYPGGHFMAAMDATSQNNGTSDQSASIVANGGWQFVSASSDGSTTRIYVNGKFEKSYSETLYTANGKIDVGADIGNSTTQFQGSIDEVKIYGRQLSDAEMLAWFNDCTVNLNDGLVAYYPMTGNANSAVGTGLDLTVSGATLTTDRFGSANSAYLFDGNSSLVSNIFSTTNFSGLSVSSWISTKYTSSSKVIWQVTGDVSYVSRSTTGHFMAAMDGHSGDNASTDESTTNVATGEWIFVSASNDGTMTRVYVNGNLEASYPETLYTGTGYIAIGFDKATPNLTTRFIGSIDEVKIYNRVLCDNEMAALYSKSETGIEQDQNILAGVSLYPNPTNGNAILKLENLSENGSLQVSDMMGRVVFTKMITTAETTIDLNNQKPGVYLVTVKSGNKSIVQKLVRGER
jgi:hypothetical protein